MHFFVSLLLVILILIFSGLYLLGAFRKKLPNEPPLDKGYIPWLGHLLDFRKDALKLLQRMQKAHGDVFTIQLAGSYVTFLMDPFSFGTIVKEAKAKLDFTTFGKELVARVFGYYIVEDEEKILHASSNKYLMGDGLAVLIETMMTNLQNIMLYDVGKENERKEWKHEGLFNFSYNIVFRAGYLALFGTETAKKMGSIDKAKEHDRCHSDKFFFQFRKFDRLFPRLVYGVLKPQEKMEAERLKRMFYKVLSVTTILEKENVSPWISEQQQVKAEAGMPEYMQARNMFTLLWASQGNTGPSSFWLLLYLMKYPNAMKAVREEVDKVLKETGQEVKPGGQLVNLTRDMLMKTPVLDSAVEESLRMTAAPILMRAVLEDWNLQMADGREYTIRKGDRLAIFPYLAVQMDSEVHPEPHIFKYDRFLNPDGTKKTEFYKNGKQMKYYTMPWGAGVSMCPGRFFVINELKQFVFLMLTYFEFELLEPEVEIPPIDPSRWGFGIMQPVHDIPFKYRLRY